MRTIIQLSTLVLFALTFSLFVGGVGFSQENKNQTAKSKKVLTVYYSRSGNTQNVARQIQKQLGGDLLEIQTLQAYPKDYKLAVEQVKKELTERTKPALKTKIPNLKNYDVVFIGSPCWWNNIAPAVSSFLSQVDLAGKTVIPFITSVSSGVDGSLATIKKLVPNALIVGAKAFHGDWEVNPSVKAGSNIQEVNQWLDQIKF